MLVFGDVSLEGTLDVLINENGGAYVDPMVPGTFDEFSLIFAASVSGAFDAFSYDGDSLTVDFISDGQHRFHVGEGLFRILDYDAGQVDLLNYAAIPGDADGNGSVDGLDFVIWNANKFSNATDWTTGDFNGDGFTDGQDFVIWNSNKFSSLNLGDSLAIQVPEAQAPFSLFMLGMLSLTRMRQGWQQADERKRSTA